MASYKDDGSRHYLRILTGGLFGTDSALTTPTTPGFGVSIHPQAWVRTAAC